MEKNNFPNFFYFLECYFNISTDYADLPELASDFKKSEKLSVAEGLRQEALAILAAADWTGLEEFVRKHGQRRLNHEKLKRMIEILAQM